MSKLVVVVHLVTFADNAEVKGLRIQVPSSKQIVAFRSNMKTLFAPFNRPIVKYCTAIATAKEVLQLTQDDLDNETLKLVCQDTLGGLADGFDKKLEKHDKAKAAAQK